MLLDAMRCSTAAAILVLGPALTYSLPVPFLQTRSANTSTEQSSVVWWRGQSICLALCYHIVVLMHRIYCEQMPEAFPSSLRRLAQDLPQAATTIGYELVSRNQLSIYFSPANMDYSPLS